MKHRPSVRTWAWILTALLGPLTSYGTELFPGKITNPAGLQWNMNAVYNSARDEYLLAYSDGRALVGHLTPTGVFSGQRAISGNSGVTHVALAYNPDANQYLLVWRNGSPNTIRGSYLTAEGNPIGSSFAIGNGGAVHLDYSPTSRLYIVSYSESLSGVKYIRYKMIRGDSSTTRPVVRGGNIASSNVLSDDVKWGGTAGKFLVAYVKDWSPDSRRADVVGKFVSADGTSVGSQFNIDANWENQAKPRLAYADDINRWLVAYEDWSEVGTSANMKASLVAPNQVIKARFQISRTTAWDVPGPVIYNPSTRTFIASWRSAFSDTNIQSMAREIDPGDGSTTSVPQGPAVLLSNLNAAPIDAAVRTHPTDPQALVLWRVAYGKDGIHAGIYHLPPAPPEVQSPMPDGFLGVPYSEKIPVLGGRTPLTYQIISGTANLNLFGLSPAPNFSTTGLITGTPTRLGTTAAFTVRVTDSSNRGDEGNVTLTIKLSPPTPTSPTGEITTRTPSYQWNGPPGATSFNLVVENLTDGGVVLNRNVSASPFTSPPLQSGKTYRWKVRASNGTQFSVFSDPLTFLIDATSPARVLDLGATIPMGHEDIASTAVASSGDANSTWSKEKATDGVITTAWSTPGRSVMQNEFLTVDLGSIKTINALKLRSRVETGLTFPVDFQIQVATEENSFATWSTVTNFVAAANTEYTVPFSEVPPVG